MKELIKHIEKLLPEHDCVVVPGLGGFVQSGISARFDPQADIFYPETKEICFNAKLTFNDGFLAQSYQESFGLSFEESNLQIRQGVQELLYKLEEGKYISLGKIGVMWKNDQELLSFRSENKQSFLPESYGLTSFSFPCIEKRQRKKFQTDLSTKKQKDEEFINIRLRRNSFRHILTGAAACLFILLLPKPAGYLPETGNQEASLLMHDYISASKEDTLQDTPKNSIAEESYPIQNNPIPELDQTEVQNAPKERIVKEPISKTPALSKIEPEPEPVVKKATVAAEELSTPVSKSDVKLEKKSLKSFLKKSKTTDPTYVYYIIIGSFPEKNMAKQWMKDQAHGDVFKSAGIVEKDGRARVYSKYFPNKEVAEAYLNQFRSNNPDYASAWLLSVKK